MHARCSHGQPRKGLASGCSALQACRGHPGTAAQPAMPYTEEGKVYPQCRGHEHTAHVHQQRCQGDFLAFIFPTIAALGYHAVQRVPQAFSLHDCQQTSRLNYIRMVPSFGTPYTPRR